MWLATQKSHMACHTGTSCGQSHSNLVWPATKDPHVTSHTGTLCGHSGEKEQPQYPYQHVLIGEGRCCATQTITASMTSETKQMTTVELMGTKAIIWRSWVRPGVKWNGLHKKDLNGGNLPVPMRHRELWGRNDSYEVGQFLNSQRTNDWTRKILRQYMPWLYLYL